RPGARSPRRAPRTSLAGAPPLRARDMIPSARRDARAAAFETHRAHLFGLAYRMLGSAADAEDVLQDAYVRWQTDKRDDVESPLSYLRTIVTRLCLDVL